MAQKKAVPTDDELSAMFAGIGDDEEEVQTTTVTAPSTQTSTNTKPTPTSSTDDDNDDDPIAELTRLAAVPRTDSRPPTPRINSSAATSTGRRSGDIVHTPPSSGSARSSIEKARNSGEATERPPPVSSGSVQQRSPVIARALTPQAARAPVSAPSPAPAPAPAPTAKSGGSWWGGLSSLASAAVKQAEAAVKEIQNNEEAQKWAEQVKGNVGALRGLGVL